MKQYFFHLIGQAYHTSVFILYFLYVYSTILHKNRESTDRLQHTWAYSKYYFGCWVLL